MNGAGRTQRVYLVVDGHGETRLVKRRPSLDWDEVAFPITVQLPQGWGHIYDNLNVELVVPSPPPLPAPSVGEPELPGANGQSKADEEAEEKRELAF